MKPTKNSVIPTATSINSSGPVASPLPQFDRLIRLREVLTMIPVSRSTFYAEVKKGSYPKPHKIGQRISVWRFSTICILADSITR